MFGSGTYSLRGIKEIKTTDLFHSLRDDQKNCQTTNTFEECATDLLLQTGIDRCGCIPFELMNFNENKTLEVDKIKYLYVLLILFFCTV